MTKSFPINYDAQQVVYNEGNSFYLHIYLWFNGDVSTSDLMVLNQHH
jgi:hypothetical protein